ncbi:hypothetical protein EDD11_007017 [Mortierella claussenii]|nr:hypothetical protein EDD11_007017 [Mortierella claussenii]
MARPASKFSLDSLMSRVLPSLDISVPPPAEGSKKFRRVRPAEGAITAALPTMANSVMPAASITATTTAASKVTNTPAPAPASALALEAASMASRRTGLPVPEHKSLLSLPADMAVAAQAAFAASAPLQPTSISPETGDISSSMVVSAGSAVVGNGGGTKKNRKRRHGKGAAKANQSTAIVEKSEMGDTAIFDHPTGENSTTGGVKRRKPNSGQANKRSNNNNKSKGPAADGDHFGQRASESGNDHQPRESRSAKSHRKRANPQMAVRNLDATPELVGVSKEDDFSTLLVKHVEHTNKMLQRDLEKQSREMLEVQKKQAKLLADQTAILANPEEAAKKLQEQQVQQQRQQQKQTQNRKDGKGKGKALFVPRKDCMYWLKGFCRNETSCTFKHDPEAQRAHLAGETIHTPEVISDLAVAQQATRTGPATSSAIVQQMAFYM